MAIDYTSFNSTGTNDQGLGPAKQWWKLPKGERPQALCAIVKTLENMDTKRQTQYQLSTRLYNNSSVTGLNGLSAVKMSQGTKASSMTDRITYNVIQSVIDTVSAKIAKTKPKALFLTLNGDYKLQKKAKDLNKFVDGIFYENDAYKLGIQVFRDACIWGDGFVHVYTKNERVQFERVLPGELRVDWLESFYGAPRQIHWTKTVDRGVLMDLFPEKRAQILNASSASDELKGVYSNIADQIAVTESFKLPSGKDAGDGLHVITLEDEELFTEEWTKDYFPFVKYQWNVPQYGYWGVGLAEALQNTQLEINQNLWVIQRSLRLAGTFKVWLKSGSKLPKEHISNEIGSIIVGEEPPQYLLPPAVQPEVYNHIQTLIRFAYEQAGISQLSANSQKPAGLNSGKALREYNDIETDRFQVVGQAYEHFFLDLARVAVDLARDIYKETSSYSVKTPGRKFVEQIDWKDIDLEDDEYDLNVFPVSSLPTDPAGKLQTIQEYMQAGLIDPITGKRLLDFPDLDQIENLSNATEDWILKTLDDIVEKGEEGYKPPQTEMLLPLAKQFVLQYIARGELSGLESEKLALLRQWNDAVEYLLKLANPPVAPPATPQVGPKRAPQSELVPNQPGILNP